MTADTSTTAGKIAVMQGFVDGKVIQCCFRDFLGRPDESWETVMAGEVVWAWNWYEYRIKPIEPREFTVAVHKRGLERPRIHPDELLSHPDTFELVKVREVIE